MADAEFKCSTIEEIEAYPKLYLNIEQVAKVFDVSPQSLRNQAHADPQALGFSISIINTRIYVPKWDFCRWLREGRIYAVTRAPYKVNR
jgi:hypothetical protein